MLFAVGEFSVLDCEFSRSLHSSSRARNERGDLLIGLGISQEKELTQNRLPRPAIAVLAMTASFKALLLPKEEYPKGEVVSCLDFPVTSSFRRRRKLIRKRIKRHPELVSGSKLWLI